MVCLGNICRSPIAEGLLQQKADAANLGWTVHSAGTNGYYDGEPPHLLSQKVCKANGLDISNQVSRKLTKEDFANYDRIYAMANDVIGYMKEIGKENFDNNKTILFLEELYPGKSMNVPDPWYGTEDGYTEVFELIDATCNKIINSYLEKQTSL